MEQAVFLGSNFKKSQLENGIVWSTKFKTVTGQYVYAVDTYPPQKIAATRFATSKTPGSRTGAKVLVETTEADGILFAVRCKSSKDLGHNV